MNIIKGLITKDLLQLKNYKKSLIIFIFIFVITGIEQESTNGMVGMIVVMLILAFGMFSMATFSYDEQAKADRYILSFPLTRKEVVLSRYILVILSTLIGAVIGTVASILITFGITKEIPNILELISVDIGGLFGIGIVEAIQIPCIYKMGAERGRLQIFIVTAIVAFLLGGIFFLGEKMNINLSMDLSSLSNFLPLILIVATGTMYYISYKISYKIYSKKEI